MSVARTFDDSRLCHTGSCESYARRHNTGWSLRARRHCSGYITPNTRRSRKSNGASNQSPMSSLSYLRSTLRVIRFSVIRRSVETRGKFEGGWDYDISSRLVAKRVERYPAVPCSVRTTRIRPGAARAEAIPPPGGSGWHPAHLVPLVHK